eukprot:3458662-Rhodomonas_salina.2
MPDVNASNRVGHAMEWVSTGPGIASAQRQRALDREPNNIRLQHRAIDTAKGRMPGAWVPVSCAKMGCLRSGCLSSIGNVWTHPHIFQLAPILQERDSSEIEGWQG